MQINTNNSTLNYILLRKNGDKLFETQNNEKLPIITLNSKTINNNMLNRNSFNKPFISAIDESTPSSQRKNNTNKINYTSSFPYKANIKNERIKNFEMLLNNNDKSKMTTNNDKNDNMSSSSFKEIYPYSKNKTIFNYKNQYASSMFSNNSDNKSSIFNKQTSSVDACSSGDSSFIKKLNKNMKKRKIKFMDSILKTNKQFLLDEYLLTHKREKKNIHGSFSKSERNSLFNNKNYSEEKKRYPLLYKDICTGKLVLKNNVLNYTKIKLTPFILSERYKHSELESNLDKLDFTKKINLKGNLKEKSNNIFTFKGGLSRNLLLIEFINNRLNPRKSIKNYEGF